MSRASKVEHLRLPLPFLVATSFEKADLLSDESAVSMHSE
jgi:hypothetical protein